MPIFIESTAPCRSYFSSLPAHLSLAVKTETAVLLKGEDIERLTAAGDVTKGGGTGREFLSNLLSLGTEPWNKWYHSGVSESWVWMDFKRPMRIHRVRNLQRE